ncbi:hypothetical protein GA0061103_5905 [Rhizobium multihospitium]|uniref:Uncharacterized protein n=1 Tax=Rhizobium multihospitium TaxID=410764 RepID=A0A1C3WNW5_9HYPH|nr:hypothetical protein GA0061103_5905 [Rhizobium multihospitium]
MSVARSAATRCDRYIVEIRAKDGSFYLDMTDQASAVSFPVTMTPNLASIKLSVGEPALRKHVVIAIPTAELAI